MHEVGQAVACFDLFFFSIAFYESLAACGERVTHRFPAHKRVLGACIEASDSSDGEEAPPITEWSYHDHLRHAKELLDEK